MNKEWGAYIQKYSYNMYVQDYEISNWLKKYVRVYQELLDRIDCHWHNIGTA
jgi:hypothetical protein